MFVLVSFSTGSSPEFSHAFSVKFFYYIFLCGICCCCSPTFIYAKLFSKCPHQGPPTRYEDRAPSRYDEDHDNQNTCDLRLCNSMPRFSTTRTVDQPRACHRQAQAYPAFSNMRASRSTSEEAFRSFWLAGSWTLATGRISPPDLHCMFTHTHTLSFSSSFELCVLTCGLKARTVSRNHTYIHKTFSHHWSFARYPLFVRGWHAIYQEQAALGDLNMEPHGAPAPALTSQGLAICCYALFYRGLPQSPTLQEAGRWCVILVLVVMPQPCSR